VVRAGLNPDSSMPILMITGMINRFDRRGYEDHILNTIAKQI
jgi:hypothetical protein